jgi:hypothetical protein
MPLRAPGSKTVQDTKLILFCHKPPRILARYISQYSDWVMGCIINVVNISTDLSLHYCKLKHPWGLTSLLSNLYEVLIPRNKVGNERDKTVHL